MQSFTSSRSFSGIFPSDDESNDLSCFYIQIKLIDPNSNIIYTNHLAYAAFVALNGTLAFKNGSTIVENSIDEHAK